MKLVVIAGVILGLAGCGANGAPLTPSASTSVSVGTGGVSTGTNIGLSNGTVSFGLGINN
jgi:hypothetical protein